MQCYKLLYIYIDNMWKHVRAHTCAYVRMRAGVRVCVRCYCEPFPKRSRRVVDFVVPLSSIPGTQYTALYFILYDITIRDKCDCKCCRLAFKAVIIRTPNATHTRNTRTTQVLGVIKQASIFTECICGE